MKKSKASTEPAAARPAGPGLQPEGGSGPLSACAEGSRLLLRAQPKAGRDEIAGLRDGRLLVRVTAAPEDGKANAAIIKLLAKALGIAPSSMSIISGETSRDKTLLIRGYAPTDVKLP